MNNSANRLVNCPTCGAPNYKGAALPTACVRCGAAMPPATPPARPVFLSLPITPGKPWLTWGLMALNILVWLAMTAAGGSTNGQVLLDFGAKYGPAILDGEYWRFFTAMFLHIGLMHLGFNSYALYVLGPEAERFFGRGRFLIIYLLTGVLSSVISYLFDSALAAGASGAIFGLVGALAAFFLHERDVFGPLGKRRLNNLVSIVVINLIIGFTVPNIDNWAHIGGLAAGLFIGWVLSPEYEVVPPGPGGLAHVVDRNLLTRRWWVLPAALLAAVGLTLLGNVRQRNTAAGYQQQGEAHLRQGEWEQAVDEFSVALEKDPTLWPAYLYRAEAYLQMDDNGAALNDFETVIQAQVAAQYLSIAYSGRGRITMLRGEPRQALIDLNQAVTLAPEQPFPHFVRGLIYYEMGSVALAVDDLELALTLGLEDEQSLAIAEQVLGILRGR